MASFSLWHWLILAIWLFLVIYPVGRILSRLGIPWAVAFLAVVPLANMVLLWVIAFVKWPRDHTDPQA